MARTTNTTADENATRASAAGQNGGLPATGSRRRGRRMAREADGSNETTAASEVGTCNARAGMVQDNTAALAAPRANSKIAQVISLLERAHGATLAELVEATGWQPHTTRAALTELRKKGRNLVKHKRGEVTCYRIAEAG